LAARGITDHNTAKIEVIGSENTGDAGLKVTLTGTMRELQEVWDTIYQSRPYKTIVFSGYRTLKFYKKGEPKTPVIELLVNSTGRCHIRGAFDNGFRCPGINKLLERLLKSQHEYEQRKSRTSGQGSSAAAAEAGTSSRKDDAPSVNEAIDRELTEEEIRRIGGMVRRAENSEQKKEFAEAYLLYFEAFKVEESIHKGHGERCPAPYSLGAFTDRLVHKNNGALLEVLHDPRIPAKEKEGILEYLRETIQKEYPGST
jgi:hypothetical protein